MKILLILLLAVLTTEACRSSEETVCGQLTPRSGVRLINPAAKWTVGETANFACLSGFTRGNDYMQMRITCLSNGQWSGQSPTCIETVCGQLTPRSGVRLINPTAKWTVGETANFACLSGFTGGNDYMQMRITCLSNGQWSGQSPTCIETVCGQLTPRSGVRLINPTAKWTVGNTANFACLSGFTRGDDYMQMRITCLSNGQWSGQSPTCIVVDNPRQDCRWLPWKEGSCVRTPQGAYRRQEIRVRIEAQNGGRKCPSGSPKQQTRMTTKACPGREYIASQIIKMVGTARPKTTRQGGFGLFRSNQRPKPRPSPCTGATNVSTGGVELLGAKCGDTENPMHRNRFRRQTDPFGGSVSSYNHRDILFLVDESGSVGTNNFKTELRLVKALGGQFCEQRGIKSDQTRVALTTFGNSHTHHFDFDEHTTKNNFLRGVDLVRFGDGSTCGVRTLEAVLEHFHERTGSRVARDDVDGLVILITDGCFNCYQGDLHAKLKQLQTSFEEKDVFVMAFMINVDDSCRNTYKHLYDGSVCFQGINFPTWEDFENLIEDIEKSNDCIKQWDKNDEECP